MRPAHERRDDDRPDDDADRRRAPALPALVEGLTITVAVTAAAATIWLHSSHADGAVRRDIVRMAADRLVALE